jgi:recombination associated protein RdgC
MEFRNVKLPKTDGTETEESANPEEVEGMILERIYLFEELIRTVNDLFRLFLEIRIGSEWREELQRIQSWVAKANPIV